MTNVEVWYKRVGERVRFFYGTPKDEYKREWSFSGAFELLEWDECQYWQFTNAMRPGFVGFRPPYPTSVDSIALLLNYWRANRESALDIIRGLARMSECSRVSIIQAFS